MDESTEQNNTVFLLQRLQELKIWQKQQEEKLLHDQEFQMAELLQKSAEEDVGLPTDDEDTTIDPDLSSLHSEINQDPSLPSWASRSSSSLKLQNDDDPTDKPIIPSAKTFEQLIEEKLVDSPIHHEAQTQKEFDPKAPKPFLRRGSGLVRYGGVGGPKSLTPKLKRSQSYRGSKNSLNSKGDSSSNRLKSSKSCPNVREQATKPNPGAKSIPRPHSNLKLKPSNQQVNHTKGKKTIKKDNSLEEGLYDSVELSFMDKIEKSKKKETEDLKAFELLEEAACDSSFRSDSSTVKKLIENVSMPSPIPNRSQSHTSTPKNKSKKEHFYQENEDDLMKDIQDSFQSKYEETENDSLMKDIQAFLQRKGANIQSEDEDDDTLMEGKNGIIMEDQPQQIILNGKEGCPPMSVENWSSDEEENYRQDVRSRKKSASSQKMVHFRDEPLSFSPPRVPKNSASYLIWSIFTKEREERKAAKAGSTRTKSADTRSPMSQIRKSSSDYDFETTLLNAKLAELQKEIEHYQKENAALAAAKRKLQQDRKQLAKEVQEFEAQKEVEKKKIDEEKKRLKRDKNLFEKSQKDRKANYDQKAQDEIDELTNKVQKVNEDMQRKELKWGPALKKLQDDLKLLEKENQQLHEDNHKLKLKTVSSKVSSYLVEPSSRKLTTSSSSTPDSGCPKNEPKTSSVTTEAPVVITNNDTNEKYSDQENLKENGQQWPPMSFSPAESLDSDVTLVSSSIAPKADEMENLTIPDTITVVDVKTNDSKGTTEKIYSDGSHEIIYTNGNRKEISADGKSTKVFYYNGDVKESLASGLVKYFYSQTNTWHLTYPDKKEVLQFNNGQEEIRYPNGTLQISFADGSVKRIDTDGTENIAFPDGTKVIVHPNGDRTLLLPSGQKEIHTATFKKREYPDGTVKILHDDGKLETRYTSGRVRIKDHDGKILHDSHSAQNNMTIQVP